MQFNDDHAFTKALVRFEELVKKYYGKPINFALHKNSALGLEKQYFEYMAQGKAVDYAIVSPAHMSTFSKAAPFIDAPFLFRDLNHWNKVLDADLLKPVADEINQKAEVMLIGYAGGGVRNIFANKPVRNLQEMKGLKVRVQGAPIWSKTFQAAGMAPTVIAYNEVYNAIQNGVIQAGENEAAGVEAMKFYEVGPNLNMTEHAITIRPLCFSTKTFNKLPKDLQAAIVKAGKEAGAYGRQVESSEDAQKLDALEKAGKLKRIPFADRAQMKKLVDPVMAEYAKEIGADGAPGEDQRASSSRTSSGPAGGTPAGPHVFCREEHVRRNVRRAEPLAPLHRLVRLGALVAARRLGRDPDHSGQPADLLALHRADPVLHLDRGDGPFSLHLVDHDRRDARHSRGHALRRRHLAGARAARRGDAAHRQRVRGARASRWSSSGSASSSPGSPGTASRSSPNCRCG